MGGREEGVQEEGRRRPCRTMGTWGDALAQWDEETSGDL